MRQTLTLTWNKIQEAMDRTKAWVGTIIEDKVSIRKVVENHR